MTPVVQPLRILEWDSAFFGRRIAALVLEPHGVADVAAGVEAARAEGVDCVYALCESDNQDGIEALGAAGARFIDVRMTFDRDVRGVATISDRAIRPVAAEDVPALRALAAASHKTSRFYVDGRFLRERCDEMFATWIEKSCLGWADAVIVADAGGRASGYATGHVRANGVGEIGLVAVDAHAQGHGLGSKLVVAMLGSLRDRGVETATVVTQGRNIVAQRLYQAHGFRTRRVQTWHHLWLDETRR